MQIGWRRKCSAPRSLAPERRTAREHLDRPEVPAAEKDLSYRDLETVLRLPFQFRPLRDAVGRLAARHDGGARGQGLGAGRGGQKEPLRLLELGAGTGLAGLRIAEALSRAGRRVHLLATDIAPERLPAPRHDGALVVEPRQLDALRDPLPAADVIFSNLLVHHFETEAAGAFLSRMNQAAALGGAVFDLDRNAWAFHFMRLFFPLWARSPVSCADSLISVQQAFRVEELLALAREAGIAAPRARRYLGLRTLLWWER